MHACSAFIKDLEEKEHKSGHLNTARGNGVLCQICQHIPAASFLQLFCNMP